MYKILMKKNTNGAWYWIMQEKHGKTLATSEAYSSKDKCKKTAEKVAAKLGTTVSEAGKNIL